MPGLDKPTNSGDFFQLRSHLLTDGGRRTSSKWLSDVPVVRKSRNMNTPITGGPDSSVGTATCYVLDGPRIESR